MRLQSVTRVLVSLLLLAGAALITSRAQAQGVRLLSPADGDTVRGAVKIQATKPNPRSGWISYKVEHGGKGDFIIAVVNPFIYRWDTRARDENGKDVYRDGQYTITATALSPQGKKVGEATATVTVKNAISAAARAESVRLNLNYKRHQQVRYQAVGSWEIKPAPDEEEPDDVYELAKDVNGAMVANWREKVMSPTIASGHAVLHIIVGSSGEQMGTEEEVTSLPSAGKVLTYVALRDGVKRLKHEVESCGQPAGPGLNSTCNCRTDRCAWETPGRARCAYCRCRRKTRRSRWSEPSTGSRASSGWAGTSACASAASSRWTRRS